MRIIASGGWRGGLMAALAASELPPALRLLSLSGGDCGDVDVSAAAAVLRSRPDLRVRLLGDRYPAGGWPGLNAEFPDRFGGGDEDPCCGVPLLQLAGPHAAPAEP